MRFLRKLSFVFIAILVLLISPGFAHAQEGHIGYEEIVIDGITYKRAITEFQKISPSNEDTSSYTNENIYPSGLQQDPYPNLDGQTVSATVLCENASQSKCISIGGIKTVASGEPVYGDFYKYTALWQEVTYNGKTYYTPLDELGSDRNKVVVSATRTQPKTSVPYTSNNVSPFLSTGLLNTIQSASKTFSTLLGFDPFANLKSITGVTTKTSTPQIAKQEKKSFVSSVVNFGKAFVNTAKNTVKLFHSETVRSAEIVGSAISKAASWADEKIMGYFNSTPTWSNPLVQQDRYKYIFIKGVATTLVADTTKCLFDIYKDPIGTVNGIASLGKMAITDKEGNLDKKILTQPWNAGAIMGGNLAEKLGPAIIEGGNKFLKESLSSPDKFVENSGKVFGFVAPFLSGAGEVNVATKGAEVAKIITTAEKASEAARAIEKIEDISIVAKGMEKATDASKASEVLASVNSADKAAGIVSRMQPDKAAEILNKLSLEEAKSITSKLSPKVADDILSAQAATGRKAIESFASKTKDGTQLTQPVKDIDELLSKAKVKKVSFDANGVNIANEIGARAILTDVKSATRASEKVDAQLVKDANRLALEFDDVKTLEARFESTIEATGRKYEIVGFKNRLRTPTDTGYRDINMFVKDSDGFLMEIRLTTKKLWDASEKEHSIYEIRRQFEDNIGKPTLSSVENAANALKDKYPETYKVIEKDIDNIIKNVKTNAPNPPVYELNNLKKISKQIFDDAWLAENK